ncbi:4-hydroxybenzoate 3-monooxygenase [Parapusillimonas granuli]|uniref:4-hydroxybenzoate 3-monooxygenase n=1 Tax=Parapusillimonas granuli TaxID=380911 RepID=A0A853G3X3_9BURK|nr:4-hydroxybenzoate 3-monooxygenase [Parapusillimonas granuli]MBB5215623.1 p-hydroxybenzoate 3-monooxygenase [Parapusillimonas granuli]MEB2400999.1 4-hydroxybenzoate 3-monooxygenase [Alcaligenaceae bacterium]NYT49710.1 4-hydroxybenzoate 3-monooxygenase [Parapusillimonas granuli]
MRTQVGIIGAGPSGLVLSHLLYLHGIDSVILESRSQAYVEARMRAGVLDSDVTALFKAVGVGERMMKEGLPQEQMEIRFEGKRRYINWKELAGGRVNMVYGQQEVVKDFIQRRQQDGGKLFFEAQALRITDLDGRPTIEYMHEGQQKKLECEIVAACDGYHGIGRRTIPADKLEAYELNYSFAWLGIVAEARPSSKWLVTSAHERGYAMHSMRSPSISRNYLQIPLTDTVDDWSDERIWQELQTRLETDADWKLEEGAILEKTRFDIRSFVCHTMRYKKMFLAGDSAHMVPPTGGRGLNQAIADVCILADGLADYFKKSSSAHLERYTDLCLQRVWHAQQFTWRMTSVLQRLDWENKNPYHRQVQIAQLEYLTSNRAAATSLAECYAGMPLQTSFLPSDRPQYPLVI